MYLEWTRSSASGYATLVDAGDDQRSAQLHLGVDAAVDRRSHSELDDALPVDQRLFRA